MKITVKYFAALCEYAQKNQEELEIETTNILDLYEMLKAQYKFPYDMESIRVAINESYVDNSYQLQDKDIVVFITPVAGG